MPRNKVVVLRDIELLERSMKAQEDRDTLALGPVYSDMRKQLFELERELREPEDTEPAVGRELAIEALRALATADALVLDKLHTTNSHRQEVIAKMEKALDVKVHTVKT